MTSLLTCLCITHGTITQYIQSNPLKASQNQSLERALPIEVISYVYILLQNTVREINNSYINHILKYDRYTS